MQKLSILFLLSLFLFAGCKKNQEVPPIENTDITNNIFRLVIHSDVSFDISLINLHPDNVTRDTVSVHANTQFSYGISASPGTKFLINVTSHNAKALSCVFLYKSVTLSPAVVNTTPDGMDCEYDYSVGQ